MAVSATAQTAPISYKKRPSIGFHFQLQDVTTAGLIGASSASSVISNNQWTKIKDLDPGMSFQYIEGLNEYVDLQVSVGAASVRYPFRAKSGIAVPAAKRLLIETDVAINVKLLKDKYFLVPYFTIGAGASMYGGTYFASYAPIGFGMQFKLGNDNFLTTNFVHRTAMSNLATNHMSYNIGIVSPLKDRPEPVKVTPPPPPAPEKDSDNDGLVDSKDKCPTVAGVARYQGCPVPDTDNDGVNDEEDKCPTLAGLKENNGCPAIKQEVAKTVTDGAKKILFATGSAKLMSSSFKALNKVAKALNDDANLKLTVEGHCDNTGSDAINDPLSENRAKSVQSYLTTKGKVDAAKIMVVGYGSKQPIADNKTAKGRNANRRVELKLNY